MSTSFILGVAAVFACLFVTTYSADPTKAPAKPFSCVTCNDCRDPFNQTINLTSQQCPSGIKTCFKFFHSDKRVQRGCSTSNEDGKECPEDQGNKFALSYCYSCYHKDCNSGRRVTEATALTFVAAAVSTLLGAALWKNN